MLFTYQFRDKRNHPKLYRNLESQLILLILFEFASMVMQQVFPSFTTQSLRIIFQSQQTSK